MRNVEAKKENPTFKGDYIYIKKDKTRHSVFHLKKVVKAKRKEKKCSQVVTNFVTLSGLSK